MDLWAKQSVRHLVVAAGLAVDVGEVWVWRSQEGGRFIVKVAAGPGARTDVAKAESEHSFDLAEIDVVRDLCAKVRARFGDES